MNGSLRERVASSVVRETSRCRRNDVTAAYRIEPLEYRRLLSFGDLEPLFGGGDGMVTTNFGNADTARAVAVQPDGKIVAVGSWDGGFSDFAIARYNIDGSLDTTFSGDGRANVTFGTGLFGGKEHATDVALQADGKIVVVGYTNNINGVPAVGGWDFAVCRLNSNGTLDTSFSGDGKTTVDLNNAYDGPSDDRADAVAIRPNGRILVGGKWDAIESTLAIHQGHTLAQFLPNGSLDLSFGFEMPGDPGTAFTAGPECSDLVFLSDGSFLVAGGAVSLYPPSWIILKYTANGNFDSSWGANPGSGTYIEFGATQIPPRAYGIALDSQGRIVMTGDAGTGLLTVVRLTPSGLLDTTFDGNGKATVNTGASYSEGRAVSVRPDDSIVVAGANNHFLIARLTVTGAPDSSFDQDGWKNVNFGTVADRAYGMAATFDGSIIAVGISGNDFALARLRGAQDIGFDKDGLATVNFGDDDDAEAVAIQQDKKVVVVGSWNGGLSDFAIARFNTNGTPDTSFSGNGRANVTFGTGTYGGQEFGTDLAIQQSDGKIIVVGYTDNIDGVPAAGGWDFGICRLNSDGTLDTTFGGGDGKVTVDFGGNDRARGVALMQADGRIVVGGDRDTNFVACRLNSDGTLDTTFGGGFFGPGSGKTGTVIPGQGHASDIALTSDGRLVSASHNFLAWHLDRFMPDGSIDSSFGPAGGPVLDLTAGADVTAELIVLADGRIVVAGTADDGAGHASDFAVARLQSDGSLDPGFDGDGIAMFDWGARALCYALAVESSGRILLAGTVEASNSDFAIMRVNADGTRDTTFSAAHNLSSGQPNTGDKLMIDVTGYGEAANGIAVQADGGIVLVGGASNPATDFAVARLAKRVSTTLTQPNFEVIQQILVQFSDNVGSSLQSSEFDLRNLTTGALVPDAFIRGEFVDPDETDLYRLTFPGFERGVLPDGEYLLTLPAGAVMDSAGNTNPEPLAFEYFFLNGDANHDARVNLADFNILAGNFGRAGLTWSQGNFDYDANGNVNLLDFNILASRFGTSVGPQAQGGQSAYESKRIPDDPDALRELLA